MSERDTIRQAFRFALAPTAEQEAFLSCCCGASRFWFNQGLALVKERLDRRAAGEDVRVPWSYKSLCSELSPVKDELCPWRFEVVVGSMQAGLEQLGRALQKSFERQEGWPTRRFPALSPQGPLPRVGHLPAPTDS
jgi:putative transposase